MADIIEVIVRPGSKRSEVVGFDVGDSGEKGKNGALRVNLKAQPQDGKANLELLKLLSKHFGRQARIKAGHSGKRKLVVLE